MTVNELILVIGTLLIATVGFGMTLNELGKIANRQARLKKQMAVVEVFLMDICHQLEETKANESEK